MADTAAPKDHPTTTKASASSTTRNPLLEPSLCFSSGALSSFLRSSRALTDDTISQNLSALSAPSGKPFSLSHQTRQPSTRFLPRPACSAYVARNLFPEWGRRSLVLEYCGALSEKDDPDDPERIEREVEERRKRESVVDERLDPYSGRREVRESRAERLRRTIREEEGVERIVRARTWDVVRTRCQDMAREWREEAGFLKES